MNEYYKEKDRELDSLIDESSEFRYSGNEKKVRILVDKGEIEFPYVKIRFKKGGNYFSVNVKKTINGKTRHTSLGRFLLALTDPKIFCDHINRNTLDNRRCNLRACTPAENARNRYVLRGKSGYKNVLYDGLTPSIEFCQNNIKTVSKASKYNNPFFLAIVADCFQMMYDPEFCTTNFDKSMYTPEFIKFIIDGSGIKYPK